MAVHLTLTSDIGLRAAVKAPARRPDGTWNIKLTVAVFRPWRGSQATIASDPAFQRRPVVCSPTSSPRRGIRPSYSGLLVQGTATSPSSTTKIAAAKLFRGHIVNQKTGADGRDRTDDLRFTKPLLYQLSYIGEICAPHYATFSRSRKQIGTTTHPSRGTEKLRTMGG